MGTMDIPTKGDKGGRGKGLSSEKREDLWSILLAAAALLFSMAAPEAVHNFFKNALYLF